MDTEKAKKAYKAIIRARTVLVVTNPFFGTLALHLKLVETTACRTMAVDGVSMFYNVDFVLSITEDELVGVIAHEVMHCAFKHMTRRGHRDPDKWNIAGDFVINFDLTEAGFKLPYPQSYKVQPGTKAHCYDPKYKGMNTEEVYELLPEPPKLYVMFGGGGKDGKSDTEQGDGAGSDNSGQNQDLGGCGGVIDAPGSNGDKAKAIEVSATWDANVRLAVNVARANNAGKLPGYLERLVADLKKPKVSWRNVTRDFIDNSMTKDFSFRRPSRRGSSTNCILPGYISDRMNKCVFVADTSGSINDKLLREFISEISGALDEGITDQLIVIYADDGVRKVDEFVQGDMVTARQAASVGGGGTNFDPTFAWIKENAADANCIVYLTDLCTTGYGEDLGIPTLWATYIHDSMYEQVAKAAPFGTPMHIGAGDHY